MEQATTWTKDLVHSFAETFRVDKIECGRELYQLFAVMLGLKAYEPGVLIALSSMMTGVSREAAEASSNTAVIESQLAARAVKVATSLQTTEAHIQTSRSASGRFKRWWLGEGDQEQRAETEVVREFHSLCRYLGIKEPELQAKDLKPFLEAVVNVIPRPRSV